MTQQNDAAERAQNVNEPFDAATDVADESFAQEWLNAEGIGNAEEANVAPRSQVVATLPDWTTFSNRNDERRERWDWREILSGGVLRTSSVALAAFGLGVFCATGWRGDETAAVDAEIVANETDLRSENAISFENAADETSLGALATIDSTTLRSEPNAKSGEFGAQPNGAEDGAVSVNWGINVASTENVGSANVNDSASAGVGNWEDSANASWATDSNWRRGVDFQRDLEASANLTMNAERFPTWNDLEANANAPTVADILNSPIETRTSVASDNASVPVAGNGLVASDNASVPVAGNVVDNVGYAAYNNNADYQAADVANLTDGATQFAGNSQNSGYNQVNGSENFADRSTVPTPAANFASVAPTSAANFASVAPTSAANYASVAPTSAPNYASVAPTSAANYASVAPAPAPNYASVAPTSAANFASPAVAEPSRAMVAQIPNENASSAAPNVPVANPNLRW